MPSTVIAIKLPRDHPCAVGFLDETGSISSDRFFGVGLLKPREPARLLRSIQKLRDRKNWRNEFKFSDITTKSLPLYQEFVDLITEDESVSFFAFVADRSVADPIARFGTHWEAHSKLAEQLVLACIKNPELVTVLADNYSTPDHILFEETLKAAVNRRARRLAVTSVCRLDSKSSDGLQAADVMISAATFEFRAEAGLSSHKSAKGVLAKYVRDALGADTCLNGWRNGRHSIAIYNPNQSLSTLVAAAEDN